MKETTKRRRSYTFYCTFVWVEVFVAHCW